MPAPSTSEKELRWSHHCRVLLKRSGSQSVAQLHRTGMGNSTDMTPAILLVNAATDSTASSLFRLM